MLSSRRPLDSDHIVVDDPFSNSENNITVSSSIEHYRRAQDAYITTLLSSDSSESVATVKGFQHVPWEHLLILPREARDVKIVLQVTFYLFN